MTVLHTRAPAKINLCLFVGPTRGDGRHELVTVMEALDLADDVTLRPAPPGATADEVHCPGVTGPNLAAAALAAFRDRTGWDGAPVRLEIVKRIPVAGGMAGGSADAAAALRLAAAAAGLHDPALLEQIGAGLGADVPSQVRGGPLLATGAGERLETLERAEQLVVLVVPVDAALTAGAVYAEADRLRAPRTADELARLYGEVRAAAGAPGIAAAGLVANDLQDAARALCPAVDVALHAVRATAPDHALVSGSGPTVLGLFAGEDGAPRAAAALEGLASAHPRALLARQARVPNAAAVRPA